MGDVDNYSRRNAALFLKLDFYFIYIIRTRIVSSILNEKVPKWTPRANNKNVFVLLL